MFCRLLVAVTECYHVASYFDHNLLGAQADQGVLRDLLAQLLPDLAQHLATIDIDISTVTLNWFLAIFFDAVPMHVSNTALITGISGSALDRIVIFH